MPKRSRTALSNPCDHESRLAAPHNPFGRSPGRSPARRHRHREPTSMSSQCTIWRRGPGSPWRVAISRPEESAGPSLMVALAQRRGETIHRRRPRLLRIPHHQESRRSYSPIEPTAVRMELAAHHGRGVQVRRLSVRSVKMADIPRDEGGRRTTVEIISADEARARRHQLLRKLTLVRTNSVNGPAVSARG